MGYIPPVRDQQNIIYQNRYRQKHVGIPTIIRVNKGKFLNVLADDSKKKMNIIEAMSLEIEISDEPYSPFHEFTGKGCFIDEVV